MMMRGESEALLMTILPAHQALSPRLSRSLASPISSCCSTRYSQSVLINEKNKCKCCFIFGLPVKMFTMRAIAFLARTAVPEFVAFRSLRR